MIMLIALALAEPPHSVAIEIPRDETIVSSANFECTVYRNDNRKPQKLSASVPSAAKWILHGSGVNVTVVGRGAHSALTGPFVAKLMWDRPSERVYNLTRDLEDGSQVAIGLTLRNGTPGMANITTGSPDPKSDDYQLLGVANCSGQYAHAAEQGSNK